MKWNVSQPQENNHETYPSGSAPKTDWFHHYQNAGPDLLNRIGCYCSYCEKRLDNAPEVEHIQPKSIYPALAVRWDNFLLACKNCNSKKSNKNVDLSKIILPDRDNTFAAFTYSADGMIQPSPNAKTQTLKTMAVDTLRLTGLDNNDDHDLGRKKRMEAWATAKRAQNRIDKNLNNTNLIDQAIETARYTGFFSIWMTVFQNNSVMRNRLIDAFPGTRDSGCFDSCGDPVFPAPNPDKLPNGGKI